MEPLRSEVSLGSSVGVILLSACLRVGNLVRRLSFVLAGTYASAGVGDFDCAASTGVVVLLSDRWH